MREYRSYGSVRGAPGNRRLYRDLPTGIVAVVRAIPAHVVRTKAIDRRIA